MPALNPYFVCMPALNPYLVVHAFMPALNSSFFHFHFSLCFPFPFSFPPSPLPPFPALNIPFRDPPGTLPTKWGAFQEDPPKGTSHPRGSHLLLEPLAHPHPPQVSLFLPLTLGHSEPIVHLFLGSSTHNVFRLCMFPPFRDPHTSPHEVGNPCCLVTPCPLSL